MKKKLNIFLKKVAHLVALYLPVLIVITMVTTYIFFSSVAFLTMIKPYGETVVRLAIAGLIIMVLSAPFFIWGIVAAAREAREKRIYSLIEIDLVIIKKFLPFNLLSTLAGLMFILALLECLK